jgi:hypothetical protein
MSISAGRTIVIVTNTLTMIVGLILAGLGIYGLTSPDVRFYSNFVPLATLCMGILVFLVSIIGCCGAIWEHRPVLISYLVILFVLVVIQLIAVIITLVDHQNIENILDKAWQTAYDNHPRVIRDIEEEYSCCGFRGTTDRAVPKRSPDACIKSPWFGYDKPCFDSLYHAYERHEKSLIIWGIILAVMQVLALVCTYILVVFIPSENVRERQYRAEHERLVQEGRGRSGEYHASPYKNSPSTPQAQTNYGST